MASVPRTYSITVLRPAARAIERLDAAVRTRIRQAIRTLVTVPRPVGCVELSDSTDRYRIRVGDHRILYEVRDGELVVIVVKVGHRRDVYR
jgi:mRNA interferase RelE/StbE